MRGRIVILIDDGVATGASLHAALAVLRRAQPARIMVAVPVATSEACAVLCAEVDEILCAWTPEPFHAVGHWYEDLRRPATAKSATCSKGPRPRKMASPLRGAGAPGPPEAIGSDGSSKPVGRKVPPATPPFGAHGGEGVSSPPASSPRR